MRVAYIDMSEMQTVHQSGNDTHHAVQLRSVANNNSVNIIMDSRWQLNSRAIAYRSSKIEYAYHTRILFLNNTYLRILMCSVLAYGIYAQAFWSKVVTLEDTVEPSSYLSEKLILKHAHY